MQHDDGTPVSSLWFHISAPHICKTHDGALVACVNKELKGVYLAMCRHVLTVLCINLIFCRKTSPHLFVVLRDR